ncbi:putative MFS transporter [Acephala macrosclerotiorum]|nr:putative MFS transporter [Acephala macrosclerotiorum]
MTQVTWDGPDDFENPKNWPMKRKWMASVPMSLFNFLAAMSSATAAPALSTIQRDLDIKSNTLLIMILSVYFLGSAIIPLFAAPLSEIFGRLIVLQLSNMFYIVFNTLCGAATSQNELIAFRFLAGMGGAGPQALGSGINGDLFRPHERGKAVAIYTLAPLLGTIIGPIAGGFLVQYVSWRWCFYIVSVASAAVQVFGFVIFRETYAPVLIQRRCKKLRISTGNKDLYTAYDSIAFSTLLRNSCIRPFKLLLTQPIIQVLSLYIAYLNGILYLMVATFPDVWTNIYGESASIGSLNYIALSVGMAIAIQFGTRLADKFYKKLVERNNGVGHPEFRLPVMILGAMIVPVGLFWYAWSARKSIHWIMPDIGAAIYAGATVLELVCVQGYLIDTYPLYAASAMASVLVLKSLLGFALPLVAPALYGKLGFAWGNSLLAFIAIFIGIPGPILLWQYGSWLRKRSPYARGD